LGDVYLAEDESTIIEAKAYFNKHAPNVVTCLKLMMDNNVKAIKTHFTKNASSGLLKHPTLTSSQFINQKQLIPDESQ
jgi:hypothetical protein